MAPSLKTCCSVAFCLRISSLAVGVAGSIPMGCCKYDATMSVDDHTYLLVGDTDGEHYVGTVSEPRRWKVPPFIRWAVSSDDRYLAAGRWVLDLRSGRVLLLPAIPGSGKKELLQAYLRWSPREPVLGIALWEPREFDEQGFPKTTRTKWSGMPFMTWDIRTGKLAVYDTAPIERDFHWVQDGTSIVYIEGAPHRDNPGSYEMNVVQFFLEDQRKEVRVLTTPDPRRFPTDDQVLANVQGALWYDMNGPYCPAYEHDWYGMSACENPRTGDVALTLTEPLGLSVRCKATGETTYVMCPRAKSLWLYAGTAVPWQPRWLSDDKHVLIRPDSLYVVDAETGKYKEVLPDVAEFELLDRDTHDMLVAKYRQMRILISHF